MDKIINKKSGVTLIIKNEIICTVNCEIHEGLKSIPAANAPSTDIPQTDIFVNGKKTYGNAYTFNDDIDAEKFVSKLPKPGQEFYRLHDNRYIETLVCEYYATDNPMNDVTDYTVITHSRGHKIETGDHIKFSTGNILLYCGTTNNEKPLIKIKLSLFYNDCFVDLRSAVDENNSRIEKFNK